MKINSKKKKIIIGLLILLSILLITLLFYGTQGSKEVTQLPKEPLELKNFGSSELPIEISKDLESPQPEALVYTISSRFYKERIEKMIIELNLDLEENEISNNEHMEWEGHGNRFTYNSISNIMTFQLAKSIYLGSEKEAFGVIYSDYFNKEYKFIIGQTEVSIDNLVAYYAKRTVNSIPIEMGYGYEYSDILRFDSKGYVKEGSLLLADVQQEKTSAPLISVDKLIQYVNVEEYPKESYVYASQLIDTLGLSYLDPRWQEIHSSASNCNSNALDLIYLYKSGGQEFLYPTYKVSATCEVEFEDETYSVPAVFYLNAISPDYISVE